MRIVTVKLRADDEIGTTDCRLFGAFTYALQPSDACMQP